MENVELLLWSRLQAQWQWRFWQLTVIGSMKLLNLFWYTFLLLLSSLGHDKLKVWNYALFGSYSSRTAEAYLQFFVKMKRMKKSVTFKSLEYPKPSWRVLRSKKVSNNFSERRIWAGRWNIRAFIWSSLLYLFLSSIVFFFECNHEVVGVERITSVLKITSYITGIIHSTFWNCAL